MCVILCYSAVLITTRAQVSIQVNISSSGSIAISKPSPSPTPSPTPKPSSTPTPSPTPTPTGSPSNLVCINDGQWYADSTWGLAPTLNVALDTSASDEYQGNPVWLITSNSENSGVDHCIDSIAPGDTIYFSCWIKTGSATQSSDANNPQAGGRIGIDMYGSGGDICGLCTPDGVGNPTNSYNTYVEFGKSTYAQVTMQFTVPATYTYVNQGLDTSYSSGQQVTPTWCILWLQVWGPGYTSGETAKVWFSDPVFTVNT